jgi:hypothetical protein
MFGGSISMGMAGAAAVEDYTEMIRIVRASPLAKHTKALRDEILALQESNRPESAHFDAKQMCLINRSK